MEATKADANERISVEKDSEDSKENLFKEAASASLEEREIEEEEEDVFCSLGGFVSDILGSLGTPVKILSAEERQPRPLSPVGHDLTQSLRLLQDLITYDGDDSEVTYGPEIIDTEGRLAVVSHLLAALVTTLEPQHLRRLATRLISDTSLWISRLFRYFDSIAFLHEDAREGVVRVCRMLLYHKYPKYASEGYEAVYARPPVIYTSTAVRPGLAQHISSMLGLGTACLRVIPCNTVVGSPVAMDTAALYRMMAEDVNAQKKPLLVIANVGGGTVGGVDNVSRIQEICCKYDAWLHVEGHALASLTLPNVRNLPAKVGDSMTLPLSTWLGIPSLPYVTLYRAFETSAVHAAGLTSLTLQVRLSSLPLWMTLQTLGQAGVISRLQHAFELGQHLLRHLSTTNNIRVLTNNTSSSVDGPTVQDLVSKPISTTQLLDTACGSIVFQYVQDKTDRSKSSEYYDSLNSWLGQVVRREVGSIPLELVHLDTAGFVLRWSPLEGPYTQHITIVDIDFFVQCLEHQIEILNSTVSQRKSFEECVASLENLHLAEIPMWAGLGGVRYIPSIYVEDQLLLESAKDEINNLNDHVVNQLRNTDSAFSVGEGSDGYNCIRFGMVTSDTDIKDLLTLVISTGKAIESSSEYLSKMTEVVKKGIEKATADLQRENEERLWQEGLLRHVPIVGSVYNWLLPPPSAGIKGRTLDLADGEVESTENTYIYHMQVRRPKLAAPVDENTTPVSVPAKTAVTASPSDIPNNKKPAVETPAAQKEKLVDDKVASDGVPVAPKAAAVKAQAITADVEDSAASPQMQMNGLDVATEQAVPS